MGKRKTRSEFIIDATNIHGDKYDYSLVNYINNKTKVKIICKEHGVFEQRPIAHINGNNCPYCYGLYKSTKQFIKESKKVHGDKYDYSLVDYVNNITKVKIICKEHGIFEQKPKYHLTGRGCKICSGNYMDNEIFLKKSKLVHKDKYKYVGKYVKSNLKISIECEKHGIFNQTPAHHLTGVGCPSCNESKGEILISNVLEENNISFIRQYTFKDCKNIKPLPFDFYLPEQNMCIEFDGKQHFEPIDHWGGEKEFKNTQKRDKIKNNYCKNNSIILLRVKYTDNIMEKIKKVVN